MNECKVCSAECENEYCSEPCYLVGTEQGFACVVCGCVTLNRKTGKNKVCSKACLTKFFCKPKINKLCAVCGNALTLSIRQRGRLKTNPDKAFYCSSQCVNKANGVKVAEKAAEKRKLEGIGKTAPCRRCGSLIPVTPSRALALRERGWILCGEECRKAHLSEKLKAAPQFGDCGFCGKPFLLTEGRIYCIKKGRTVFCSGLCAAQKRKEKQAT